MERSDYLFHKHDLRSVYDGQKEKLKEEVDGFRADYLLNISPDDVHAYLLGKYRIEPLTLHPEQATSPGAEDVDIDVSHDPMRTIRDRSRPFYLKGTQVTVRIPFTGNRELYYCRPATFNYNPPSGRVGDAHLELSFEQLEADVEKLKAEYERVLHSVNQYFGWIRTDLQGFNDSLPGFVADVVAKRRDKLLRDRNMEAALGIPLTRTATPAVVPAIKRKPPVSKPKAATTPFTPEPTVPDEEYDHILDGIENMVLVMERSPHAFAKMDEESLRDHILVQLNGHYEGQATGETFNFAGKTDILIRIDGKNAFIAECKFWNGPKEFLATIDQLLGYTSFRDTKTALIIFNKNKDHSRVLQTISDTLPTHSRFRSDLGNRSESHFRTVFRHPNDDQRNIYVATLAFHIPNA